MTHELTNASNALPWALSRASSVASPARVEELPEGGRGTVEVESGGRRRQRRQRLLEPNRRQVELRTSDLGSLLGKITGLGWRRSRREVARLCQRLAAASMKLEKFSASQTAWVSHER